MTRRALRLVRGGLLEKCPQRVEPRTGARGRPGAGPAFVVILCGVVLGAAGVFLLVAAFVAAR